MNFTKTPPTEPGNYWWRQHSQCKPECRMVFEGNSRMLVTMHPWGRCEVDESIGEWGDRIEFPGEKPVLEDVLEYVNWLRKIANQERFLGAWSETTKAAVQKVCDYIDPPKELPPVTLPGDLWQQLCDLAGIGFSDATGENSARISQLIRDANRRITSGATP